MSGVPVFAADAGWDAMHRALARRAVEEDRCGAGIEGSIALLRRAHLLDDSGAENPAATARRLMRVAGANLSAARIYEGHVNALRIVEMHGEAAQRARIATLVADGGLLGVWGADGDVPLRTEAGRLTGCKIYASGLGVVSHAIVSVDGAEGRIGLIDVRDPARRRPQEWTMPGMRATVSGGFDFTGLSTDEVEWIGRPGRYTSEPGFVSGVWRIAALQLGATAGLLDAAARRLRSLDRMRAEPQLARLTPLLIRAMAARQLTLRAAVSAESPGAASDPEAAVALSVSARLLTEEIGQDAIAAVERSVGLSHFAAGSETGRIARDLAVYLRQAARDALLVRAGTHMLARDVSIWELMA